MKRKKKKKKNKLLIIYKLVIFLLIIALLVAGVRLAKDFIINFGADYVVEKSAEAIETLEPFSVLIIGTDADRAEDGSEGARSDVLMVATFSPENERGHMEVNVVSIPRDTIAYITCGDYYDKVNAAYSVGLAANNDELEAINCAVDTVEHLLNIPIDYYMEISFNGVIALIDAIGGIEITSPYSFCEQDSHGNGGYSDDINNCEAGSIVIYEGTQTMNGEEALAYCRQRYGSSTYERDMRQQEVIAATITKILSDPAAYVKPALDVFNEYVTTNLDADVLADFVSIFVTVFNNSIESLDSTTPVIVDVISSPYANTTEVESALSGFAGLNLENVEAKPITEVWSTYDDFETQNQVKQIYLSQKATTKPTTPEDTTEETTEDVVEPFEIEIQTMSVKSVDLNTANGYYSYIDQATLYYVSNVLRTSLGLEVMTPTFDYNEAAMLMFGVDLYAVESALYTYYATY